MTPGIAVVINGESREISSGLTVLELLALLKIPAATVAVQHNLDILPRARWQQTLVQPGDQLEIVHFVGGG